MPKVSVIIVNYNRKNFMVDLLEKLQRQTYPFVEVIVVDNNSADGSCDVIKAKFPKVRLLRNKYNVGLYAGFNQGFKVSVGDIIVGLDSDTFIADPHFIERIVEKFKRNPSLDLIACSIRQYGTGQMMWDNPPHSHIGDNIHGYHCIWYNASGFAIRRHSFQECGLYDDSFFVYEGEWDFMMRFLKKKGNCGYFPDLIVFHRNVNARRQDMSYWKIITRNRFYIYWKYYPIPYILFRILKPEQDIIKRLGIHEYFKVIYRVMKEFPRILRKREPLPLKILVDVFRRIKVYTRDF
jgi:hypothetical protein